MAKVPDIIPINDLESYTARQLRAIACDHAIGVSAQWRNMASKTELIDLLKMTFTAEVPTKKSLITPTNASRFGIAAGATPAPRRSRTVSKVASEPADEPTNLFSIDPEIAKALSVPKPSQDFCLSTAHKRLFSYLLSKGANGNGVNALMTGPKGCGKTSTAYEFAAIAKLEIIKMMCPLVREPRDWFGSKVVDDGRVFFEESLFSAVVQRGHVVIVLDEITRATSMVLNGLFGLLDHTRETFIPESKRTLRVGPHVYFFATANIGAEYTGTMTLDSAFDDRFDIRIPCQYLGEADEVTVIKQKTGVTEAVAKKLVTVARKVRDEANVGKLTQPISTRLLLATASAYKALGDTGFEYTVLPRFTGVGGRSSDLALVTQIIQSQFPTFTAATTP